MVLPLIPIALGVGSGLGIGSLLGLGKKDAHIEEHAPYEHFAPQTEVIEAEPYQHYSPQLLFAPQKSYSVVGATYQIESPGAVSKKEIVTKQVSRPEQEGAWTYPIEMGQTSERAETEGTNMTHIALIIAGGMLGYGIISTLGDKKRK